MLQWGGECLGYVLGQYKVQVWGCSSCESLHCKDDLDVWPCRPRRENVLSPTLGVTLKRSSKRIPEANQNLEDFLKEEVLIINWHGALDTLRANGVQWGGNMKGTGDLYQNSSSIWLGEADCVHCEVRKWMWYMWKTSERSLALRGNWQMGCS